MINICGIDKEKDEITIEFENGTRLPTTASEILDLSGRLEDLGFER